MSELELLDAAELVNLRGAGFQGQRLVEVRDRPGVFPAERVKAAADIVTLRISRIDFDCFGGQREGIRPVTFQLGRLRPIQHFVKDRKSTRLNSSHGSISYAVFCLKKKTKKKKLKQ